MQINQPTRCNGFTSLLLDVYVWLNMFRASLRPSSGAYNCTRSLWFYRWRVAVRALLVVVWQVTSDPFPLDFHCGHPSGHSTVCPLIDMAKLMGVFWQHLVANSSQLSSGVFLNSFSVPLFTLILTL